MANVLFPFGTFWMRKFGKVACEAAEAVEEAILGPAMDPTAAELGRFSSARGSPAGAAREPSDGTFPGSREP
ncbi:MAG TPA: hypothetical protein VF524_13530, partial [Polyangia bacterium]